MKTELSHLDELSL